PAEKSAARQIRPELIRAHVRFLASELLEGRGPASRGDRLAEEYIAAQLEGLGLEPGAPDGTWYQPFDVVGITSEAPAVAHFTKGGQSVDLRYRDDYVAFSGVQGPQASTGGGEVVFVGYGIVAPEYQWDDYKGADLKGKTLVMLVGDPPVPDPANPSALDAKTFGGGAMTYYGRWTYKYEIGAMKRAAGVLIVHETGPA